MKLISMADFVLEQGKHDVDADLFYFLCSNYAQFLKQPLTLGMFIPCDKDGSIWKYPPTKEEWEWCAKDSTEAEQSFKQKEYQYQKAKERVLFEEFDIIHQDNVRLTIQSSFSQLDYNINKGEFKNYNRIEDLVHLDLTITPQALKKNMIMKNTELKVGQSFDVVEVLDNLGYSYLKGKQGIATKSAKYDGFDFKEFCPYNNVDPYLFESEIKNIAKLTITKLK